VRLRRALAATVQWQPVGVRAPQDAVQVLLSHGAAAVDVTDNNVVVALKPFTVGIGQVDAVRSFLAQSTRLELKFVDRQLQSVIGVLRLERADEWHAAEHGLTLFEVRSGKNQCAGWLRRAWDAGVYRWWEVRKKPAVGLTLPPSAVEQTMIFYMCPRPVFLVSVADGEHSNIFPMDLLGPIGAERFTLALRNTSPSIATISTARKLALSAIAVDDCKVAYQLGAHHRKRQINIQELPFAVRPSQRFSLPVPAMALQVREVEILDVRQVGSHTLFLGRIVAQQGVADVPQLFHTCGIYQKLRARDGRAFPIPS
jgi:flavin reductase (DIM6/NTAB) family NADH-FMN oxidoreductase RutF